jgi:hypothetical protein
MLYGIIPHRVERAKTCRGSPLYTEVLQHTGLGVLVEEPAEKLPYFFLKVYFSVKPIPKPRGR